MQSGHPAVCLPRQAFSLDGIERVRPRFLTREGTHRMLEPETYTFEPDGRFPNSRLPALVYRGALSANAEDITRTFAVNGWSNAWLDGIFPYHHFHSIAHEVLGIADGEVEVALGGPSGRTVTLVAGDAVVIPAGVAHRNVGQSSKLAVVGAYPGAANYDVKRGEPGEYVAAIKTAAAVSPSVADPITGADGRLQGLWDAASTRRTVRS